MPPITRTQSNTDGTTTPATQVILGCLVGGEGVTVGTCDNEMLVSNGVAEGDDGLGVIVFVARGLEVVTVAASSRYTVYAFHPMRQP